MEVFVDKQHEKAFIVRAIERDYRLSDRELATLFDKSPTTIGKYRKQLESEGKILPKLDVDTCPQACLHEVSTSCILPSPENDSLYDPVRHDCPEFLAFCDDIRINGILQHPIVSADGYLISGHRRHAAALQLGLDCIVVEVDPKTSRARDKDSFIKLLASHNRQRTKSLAETLREEVACMGDFAWQDVHDYREHASAVNGMVAVRLGPPKRRPVITEKLSLKNAIEDVVRQNRKYWPLSDRKIFYLLLNIPRLLRNDARKILFENNEACYNDVTDMLTRLRIDGSIPFDCIADETRPVIEWDTHKGVGTFIHEQLDGIFSGYWRDLTQSQSNHIEILAEKNTIATTLRDTAAMYTIPMTSGRGYSSLPPRKAMVDRFKQSGREKLIVVCVTDFDPEGLDIPASFGASLRDDFGVDDDRLLVARAALNYPQIQSLNLHEGQLAKEDSSRYAAFKGQFGERCWELEAVPASTLIDVVEEAIMSVLDMPAFEHELERQSREQLQLDEHRQTVKRALSGIEFGGEHTAC